MSKSKAKPSLPLPPPIDTDLPEGWAMPSLGQLVSPSKEKIEPGERPDSPYLSLEHIESGTGRILGHGLASDVSSTKAIFRAGDVLYGKLRPYLNKVCIPDFDGICSTDIVVFPKSSFVESRYLLSLLMQPSVVEFANHNMSGVQLPRISFEKLSELEMPLSPLAEQKRIVAKVEALLERVSAARARLAKVPAILKRFRQSVLAAACSGQLTTEWREGHPSLEPAEALLERLRRERPALKRRRGGRLWGGGRVPEITDEERESLPATWAWVKVADIGSSPDETVQVGPMSMQSRDFAEAGIPVLNVGCVQYGHFDETKLNFMPEEKAAAFERYRIQPGDVLFTRSGTIGRCAVAGSAQNGYLMTFHLLRVRPDSHRCLAQYAQYVFQGASHIRRQMEEAAIGSTRAGFNTLLLAGLDFPLPPLAEQREIVRRVEALFAMAEQIEGHVRTATVRAERLPQAILARAFHGELVPTEADLAVKEGRDYEPASILLARIQEERKQTKPARGGHGDRNMARRSTARRPVKGRRPLDEVLREQGKPMTPERLFDLAGFDEGSVDEFYEQLRELVRTGKIHEDRPNTKDVFLEVVGK